MTKTLVAFLLTLFTQSVMAGGYINHSGLFTLETEGYVSEAVALEAGRALLEIGRFNEKVRGNAIAECRLAADSGDDLEFRNLKITPYDLSVDQYYSGYYEVFRAIVTFKVTCDVYRN